MSSWTSLLQLVGTATAQTLTMVFFSTIFSLLLGTPLGILLCVTAEGNLLPKPMLHQLIGRFGKNFVRPSFLRDAGEEMNRREEKNGLCPSACAYGIQPARRSEPHQGTHTSNEGAWDGFGCHHRPWRYVWCCPIL